MAPIKTTYKSDYVRPKVHHYTSVSKLKKNIKFSPNVKNADRRNKCLEEKYVKLPETIDLYPFVKIYSYEEICSDPNVKTTYQNDFPDNNPNVSSHQEKKTEPPAEIDENEHPCRFLYDPNRYPRLASDITHNRNSTKRNVKSRYPRVYTDVTKEKIANKMTSNKVVTISRHLFDRTKESDISDALPGGKCVASTTEYQDGIGAFAKGIIRKKKPDPRLQCSGNRICKNESECPE